MSDILKQKNCLSNYTKEKNHFCMLINKNFMEIT